MEQVNNNLQDTIDNEVYHTPNGIIRKLNTFKGKKVLIGDYSNASFYNTNIVLESLGLKIVREETIQGIYNRVYNNENYDAIITNNVYQNGHTGLELLEKLKELENFSIPVIIHTISNEPKEKFLSLGFDGHLQKPIKQEEVIDLLNKLL